MCALPSVSVVIPCYNAAKYIQETLESVLSQSIGVLEVLVVDDGSTDESRVIAERFPPPVRVITQRNQGESVARNAGIDQAQGEWIAFLDADDVWAPNKLATQLQSLAGSRDVICIHTGYDVFGAKQETIVEDEYSNADLYTVERLLLESSIHVSTAMVKRDVPVRFPAWTRHGEDMIYFAELALHGGFAYVAESLGGYRVHGAMQTRSSGFAKAHLQSRFAWIERTAEHLGRDKAESLRRGLLAQVIAWTDHARWNRDWVRYWDLRQYAASLHWPGKPPRILMERPWSPVVYRVKDWLSRRLFASK